MGHTNLLFEEVERGHRNTAQAFYHDIGIGEKVQLAVEQSVRGQYREAVTTQRPGLLQPWDKCVFVLQPGTGCV